MVIVQQRMAEHWTLDPEIEYLNHGSFGACPRPILELQADLRAEIEREPVDFLYRRLAARLAAARCAEHRLEERGSLEPGAFAVAAIEFVPRTDG